MDLHGIINWLIDYNNNYLIEDNMSLHNLIIELVHECFVNLFMD